MPHGKIKVQFVDGSLDGKIEYADDTESLLDRIEYQNGKWIRENDDGSAQIMSSGKLDSNWNYFKIEIYEKQERFDGPYPFVFQFIGTEDVSRCEAKTKQGKRCKNRAVKDQNNCSKHTVK
jgi:hypothetical protein